MSDSLDGVLDTCGCCEGLQSISDLYNPLGRHKIDYRIGTYHDFLSRMLAFLLKCKIPDGPQKGSPPLAGLTTRDQRDPSLAIMDAWAVILDVLAFYQERIANEGYLATANERRSVLDLARAIGYELSPGVAASAYLAFTIEDAEGAPKKAVISKGTKVQSVPGQGQIPQVFETDEEFTAYAKWNELLPRLTQPQVLNSKKDIVYLEGLNNDVKVGSYVLFVEKGKDGKINAKPKLIVAVHREEKLNRTRIDLAFDAKLESYHAFKPQKDYAIPKLDILECNKDNIQKAIIDNIWHEKDLAAYLAIQGWDAQAISDHVIATQPKVIMGDKALTPEVKLLRANVAGGNVKEDLPPAELGLYAFKVQSSPFGHNAPRWDSLPPNQRYPIKIILDETKPNDPTSIDPPYPKAVDWDINEPPINKSSKRKPYSDADFFFERSIPEVTKGSWVLLKGKDDPEAYRIRSVTERSLSDFALSAKATGVKLKKSDGGQAAPNDLKKFKLRSTIIYASSYRLNLAPIPIEEPFGKGTEEEKQLTLNGWIQGLQKEQYVIISGELADFEGTKDTELAIISDVVHSDITTITTIFFKSRLKNKYVRNNAKIFANIVPATHGDTAENEVLGGGDGSQANQRFALKKPPLTYIPSSDPGGRDSTLKIRVDGVLWKEASQLYGLNECSKNYIVQIDDDGKTSVIFGDGIMGTRLPTGVENIVATYRSGIGRPGMVEAGRLTLLQTRPQGVRSVTNPLPATGAEEPETLDNARANAPLKVRTFDRIVSLKDFEDFARSYAGVGKAQAISFKNGETEFVHITVAAAIPIANTNKGAFPNYLVEPESKLYGRLIEAIKKASDSTQRFVVDTYQPNFFELAAKIWIDPRYEPSSVMSEAEAVLKTTFSFQNRDFGQPVSAAEVISVIHKVRGITAVDLDKFYRIDEPPIGDQEPDEILKSETAKFVGEKWKRAQLLLINPAGIRLEEVEQ